MLDICQEHSTFLFVWTALSCELRHDPEEKSSQHAERIQAGLVVRHLEPSRPSPRRMPLSVTLQSDPLWMTPLVALHPARGDAQLHLHPWVAILNCSSRKQTERVETGFGTSLFPSLASG
eukprot:2573754-Amphidinium_carterae.1